MAEEGDTLISLGLDFLNERLAEVETRIERLNTYLTHHYPDPNAIPVTEAGRMQNYEAERKLLKDLRLASQDTPFIEVHRRRLAAARQRVTQLLRQGRGIWTAPPEPRVIRPGWNRKSWRSCVSNG